MTIYTSLIGGLGNQMFQYAAGRALALHRKTDLRLDVSGFSNYQLHQGFELKRVFSCPAELATAVEVRRLLGWQSGALARRILAKPAFAALRRPELVIEPHFNYWTQFENAPDNAYLDGYWQSEKYFRGCEAEIRADFTFQPPLDESNAELAAEISSINAVSLHVRRGDYARNPKTLAVHGLCSPEYYRAAIDYLAERIDSPCFFVFSDDIRWAQENLGLNTPCRFVDHNQGEKSYVDMQLMSMCKHHIVANSSFSWWGAWLNSSSSKIVVAPRRWFANDTPTSDLVPATWVRL